MESPDRLKNQKTDKTADRVLFGGGWKEKDDIDFRIITVHSESSQSGNYQYSFYFYFLVYVLFIYLLILWLSKYPVYNHFLRFAQLAGAVEYTDCFSAEG